MRINGDRLWDTLMDMAKIGPGIAGGNNRQTLTDADAEGRSVFKTWCDKAGMTVGVDKMGTMFATRAGTDPNALPVYVGSHLDTQPTGGKYDGVLGVLAALEVVRTMNDLGIKTKHPIVVTNWANEEGARFAPAMLASGVFAGVHTLDYAYGRKDPDGKTYGDELKRIGWLGDEEVGARKMHAYFEYHIEQGPILEAENKTIGVVTHCQGLWWLEFTLTGKEAHTGSTPMAMRVNAGLAMSRIVEMVQSVAMENQPGAVFIHAPLLFGGGSVIGIGGCVDQRIAAGHASGQSAIEKLTANRRRTERTHQLCGAFAAHQCDDFYPVRHKVSDQVATNIAACACQKDPLKRDKFIRGRSLCGNAVSHVIHLYPGRVSPWRYREDCSHPVARSQAS